MHVPRLFGLVAASLVLGLAVSGCLQQNASGKTATIPAEKTDRIKEVYAKCLSDDLAELAFFHCEKAVAMMAAADLDATYGTDVFDTAPADDVKGGGAASSIRKFPQITLRDTPGALEEAVDDEALASLEHRGGDAIAWSDYVVNVYRASATPATVRFAAAVDAEGVCASGAAVPSGSFSVGDKIHLCEDGTDDWTSGDLVKVQIVDEAESTIVYEVEVVAT